MFVPSAPDPPHVESSIDPDDLAITLRVLEQLPQLSPDHPDIRTVKRATGRMYKQVRNVRRRLAKQPQLDHDAAVLARTATGSAMRIDDETRGILLEVPPVGTSVGELLKPRGCYVCKTDYTSVDAFYHWLCPVCAAKSHHKRTQRADLTGKRALLTGGRAKIGMYIALLLLRDGAELTITTRFPRDAARRFAAHEDAAQWIDRLTIVGIDLRDPAQVISLADRIAEGGPLDILINNAAQTVRRSAGAYAHLVAGEETPLESRRRYPDLISYQHVSQAHPASVLGSLPQQPVSQQPVSLGAQADAAVVAAAAARHTENALAAGQASLEAHLRGDAIDAGGLLPDERSHNSWTQVVDEVDPMELLEVQLCNATAPFLLVSRLRPSLRAAVQAGARRAYVVNVSAMEGQFSRRYKGPGHPHTNMAKAALNMLTRTSAGEMFSRDKILMTAVDTGWITDERPHPDKLRIASEGWHAPLDLVDGAARVYDPIVRGEAGEDLYGCFVKDFEPSPW